MKTFEVTYQRGVGLGKRTITARNEEEARAKAYLALRSLKAFRCVISAKECN
jgi:hypothetical protein